MLRELEEEAVTKRRQKRYHVFNLLGVLAINEERDSRGGAALWEESLALARETGTPCAIGMIPRQPGIRGGAAGRQRASDGVGEESLAYARKHEDREREIVPETLVNLGLAALGQGDHGAGASPPSRSPGDKPERWEKGEPSSTPWKAWPAWREPGGRPAAARLWGAAEAATRGYRHRPAARRAGAARTLPGLRPFPAGEGGVGGSAGRRTCDVARRGRRIRPRQGNGRPHRHRRREEARPANRGQPYPSRAGGRNPRRQGPHQPPDLEELSSQSEPRATT